MIDIQSYFMSLKASWVSRLVSNQLVDWNIIPCKYFAKLGKEWLVFSQNLDNITVNIYTKQIPEFYGEVLRSWNKIWGGQTRTPLNFADVRKQIIWGTGLTLEGEEVALWRLTFAFSLVKSEFQVALLFWSVALCRRPRIFSTCHLWKCQYRARVYWNLSYPLLSILKMIFLESNPLRFIETLISFIRGFVYCLYMPSLK